MVITIKNSFGNFLKVSWKKPKKLFHHFPIKAFLFSTIFTILFGLNNPTQAQCPNDNIFHTDLGVPPCDNFATETLGGGTYVTFDVVEGASYAFSTCGSPINTQLTGYVENTGALAFYNAANGPYCSPSQQASINWTASFTGTLRVLVDESFCTWSTTSATLEYRQNNNLTLDIPEQVCLEGGIVDLSGTQSPAGGTFSGVGVTGQVFNPLAAGIGTHTITYSFGACSVSEDIIVSELSASVVTTSVSCKGDTDGTAVVIPSGGAPPYETIWNITPPQTTDTVTGLAAGTYSVDVIDDQGCNFTAFATVSEPDQLYVSLASKKDPSCVGGSDGEIDITVSGGTIPYSFDWSNGNISEDALNLSADTHTVTVTDANGCIETLTAVLNDPDSITASISVTDPSCYGAADGSLTLDVSGGNAPYTYQWSNFEISQNLDSVPAGNYSVIITDAKGCITNASATVTNPPAIELETSVISNACLGDSTAIAVVEIIGGGIAPYSIEWNTNPPQFTDTVTNLSPGTYTVTVTDSTGCSISEDVLVPTVPGTYITLASKTNPSCNGFSNGYIDISVNGGMPPYSFVWSNGDSTEDATGLPAGIHEVLVTDANGCETSASFTLSEPDSLFASAVATDVTCYGDADGSIDLTVTGGTASYSYFWSNFEFTQNLTNVSGGTYVVQVTDSLGCVDVATVVVNEPSEIMIDGVVTAPSCGADNGAIDLTVTGGLPPYDFNWSNNEQTQNLQNIGDGTYTVIVTDSTGCSAEKSFVLPASPEGYTIDFTVNEDLCVGQSVEFTNNSSVTSGTYFSFWDFGDGKSSTNKNPIHTFEEPGTYDVTLTMHTTYNCVDSLTQTVTVHALPLADISPSPSETICEGDEADLTAPSGDYTYLWSTKETTQSITVNSENLYSVTVTDIYGCEAYDSLFVSVVPNPDISVSPDTTISIGESAHLQATGGTFYTWSPEEWLDNPMVSDPFATPLETTTFTVVIESPLGCTNVDSVTVTVVEDYLLNIPNLFTPNQSGMNEVWRIGNIEFYETCEVHVFNRWGSKVFGTSNYQNDWDGKSSDGNKLSDGTYYYVISCNNDERVYKGAITILR